MDLRDVKRVFDEAAELGPAERPAYLDAACAGDAETRRRVETLLRAIDEGGGFMAGERLGEALGKRGHPDDSEGPGCSIGPYELIEPVGEGGFGTVYLAEQHEPVRRRVALKIIKLGMDTRQVIARFEAERQALAMMDHPGIARVFDAGATESGRPYFVMELVRGEPITTYCDRKKLPIRERLGLFAQVCAAVQHAHQKGIIHRDLKPFNVLVSEVDGRPTPKIIDFGIAKATDATGVALTDQTLVTDFRQFMGTPEYMSPEQAGLGGDIDTRSDIYSLGVLLYELLAGSPPFDARRLRSAAWEEMRRIIREAEPEKPSTRLYSTGRTRDIAAQRSAELGRLIGVVRGDLDWIVMKCLEKDRAMRYDTANALAMDIGRYITGEPVVAAPPRRGYRLRKFLRRNRAPVAGALALTAVLLAGTISTSAGLFWALAAEGRAKARADELENTVAFLESQLEGMGATLWLRTARASNPGFLVEAVPTLQAALAEREHVLGPDDPRTLDFKLYLGQALYRMERFEEAEPYHRAAYLGYARLLDGDDLQVLECMTNLGGTLRELGRFDEAIELGRTASERVRHMRRTDEARRIFTSLKAHVLTSYATTLAAADRFPEALEIYLEAYEFCESEVGPDDARTRSAARHVSRVYRVLHERDPAAGFDADADKWWRLGPYPKRAAAWE